MNPNKLTDQALHRQLKELVHDERQLVTRILHHLNEVERRKLFSDFGCSSLFAYAVDELGYSEGQAHRRIQAMRLIREIPQIEEKIASGSLSLSNVSQAQSLFKAVEKSRDAKSLDRREKVELLARLENKSAREGQKELMKSHPQAALPKERERVISDKNVEVRLVIDNQTKGKLEEVRSLLGPKGASMGYAELLDQMADLSVAALKARKFGKKRTAREAKNAGKEVNARQALDANPAKATASTQALSTLKVEDSRFGGNSSIEPAGGGPSLSTLKVEDSRFGGNSSIEPAGGGPSLSTLKVEDSRFGGNSSIEPAGGGPSLSTLKVEDSRFGGNSSIEPAGGGPSLSTLKVEDSRFGGNSSIEPAEGSRSLSTSKVDKSDHSRFVPRKIRYAVWVRDGGKCCACGSKRNLHIDHIVPVALGGRSIPENLRLLCFNCNQRAAIKLFGEAHIGKMNAVRYTPRIAERHC